MVSDAGAAHEMAAADETPVPQENVCDTSRPAYSFRNFASQHNLSRFADLLESAGLTSFIETSEASLTIFAPSEKAIDRLSGQFPTDDQLLRELLCVHISMGSMRCAT